MKTASKLRAIGFALLLGLLNTLLGWAQDPGTGGSESIVLGLLIEDSTWSEGRFGAELAVQEINRKGGLEGHPVVLSVNSMEGPWGEGSKRAVDLVFDQKAWALVGILNGRNSHLVEQVSAKTDVPFISAWAADPTLSKAYVPQFFNCVPNSEQQFRAILHELAVNRSMESWMLVSDDSYDSDTAVRLLKNLEAFEKHPPSAALQVASKSDFESLKEAIAKEKPEALILFCQPGMHLDLVRFLRSENLTLPVYGDLNMLHEEVFSELASIQSKDLFTVTSGTWMEVEDSSFSRTFFERYGRYPSAMAAYAYDAIFVLSQAIVESGLSPKNLKKSLSETSYRGITGSIEFDRFGNREKLPETIRIGSKSLSFSKP